jgi:signal transduction histidine kinase
MPPEVQARAFEPFFTTKDVGEGTGLGLDISRRIIVDRHHGEIEIDSKPGETMMRVILPVDR